MISKDLIRSISTEVEGCIKGLDSILERAEVSFRQDYPEVERVFSGFREKNIHQIKQLHKETIDQLRAPMYVGMLGRYSHGKTSLINALFDLSGESELPTGSSVTTSRICVIQPSDEIQTTLRVKSEIDGKDAEFSSTDFSTMLTENSVQSDSRQSYSMVIPCSKESDVGSIFIEHSIALVDMPGLGGPFFNDNELTNAYLEDLDLLCVVIKATEVPQAAFALNKFLDKSLTTNTPKIIVATFWESTSSALDYSHLSDEDERQAKFRELVEKEIPSLSDHLQSTIFVDSLSESRIGILNLRTLIRSKIVGLEKLIVGRKPKNQVSMVFRRKIGLCSQRLSELVGALRSSITDLQSRALAAVPHKVTTRDIERELQGITNSVNRSFSHFAKRDLSKLMSDAKYKFRHNLSDLKHVSKESELIEQMQSIQSDANENILNEFLTEAANSFSARVVDPMRSELLRLTGKYSLDNDDLNIDEIIDDCIDDIKDSVDKFELPSIAIEALSKEIQAAVGSIIKQITNPSVYGWALAAVGALILSTQRIPVLNISLEFFRIVAFILFAVSLAKIYPTYQKQRQIAFRNQLNKLSDKFEKHFNDHVKQLADPEKYRDVKDKLDKDISSELKMALDPHAHLTSDVKISLDQIVTNVERTIDHLEREKQRVKV